MSRRVGARGMLRTLSHKVFEVMPLNIVGQVADVDAAILLR
jgi:hypothetical protein